MSTITNWIFKKICNWFLENGPPRRAYLSHFDQIKSIVKPCDVLLIEGRSRISRIIQQITTSPWSHSILYIGKYSDIEDPMLQNMITLHYKGNLEEQLIIESEMGKGTVVSPLSKYQDDHIRILRPIGLSKPDGLKVLDKAIQQIGLRYSWKSFFDLAVLFLPWNILPQSWRAKMFQYKATKPKEEICSTMIAYAFLSIHFPILPVVIQSDNEYIELIQRNPNIFTPSDFDFSPYFEVIKYPIFNLKETDLANLPWKKGVMSNDRGVLIYTDEKGKNKKE